jgi:putative glutamine amidotransferase
VIRPLLGITLGEDERQPGFVRLREDYVRSVVRAGAVAVALPPCPPGEVGAILDRLDGVVLSGGADVDQSLYGETPHPRLRRVDRARDDFELALVRGALDRDLPILAICRGHQVLNVATGGTLVQDLPSVVAGGERHDCAEPRTRRVHAVDVRPGTLLSRAVGEGPVSVNSIHHQAVARLGPGLVASAHCTDDGVVEGIEMPGRRFVVGVQWHPESFWGAADSFQPLFDAHAEACRAPAPAGSR